jgi:pimeloyl-ACP methyl ester carboxylesterase
MISDCAFARLNNGVRLAYVEQGERDGPAVILLHGYTDTHRSFDLLRPLLPRAWRVIAVTQRGHGRSDKPEDGYRIDDFAADVVMLLDALGVGRAVLVGHSMGAAVALQAAAEAGDRVAGLALIGAFADFRGNAGVAELARVVATFEDPIDPEFVLAFQESTIADMVPQRFLDLVISESLRCPARVWRAAARGMLLAGPRAGAARCRAPAAILWGEEDGFCPRSDQLALRDTLGSARLFAVPGAGHALHWEKPAAAAAHLAAFVGELADAGALTPASALA